MKISATAPQTLDARMRVLIIFTKNIEISG